jgi:hypothetical protein
MRTLFSAFPLLFLLFPTGWLAAYVAGEAKEEKRP